MLVSKDHTLDNKGTILIKLDTGELLPLSSSRGHHSRNHYRVDTGRAKEQNVASIT